MKCWLEIENFSGKPVLSIYQGFHAKAFSKYLTSAMAFPKRESVRQANESKKYAYQINFVQTLSKTKDAIALLFQRSKSSVLKLISDLHNIFSKTTEPVWPGITFPHNHKVIRRKYFLNYKPIC